MCSNLCRPDAFHISWREIHRKNISEAIVRIKPEDKYWRLYVYSYTARMLAKLLYGKCLVALDRELARACIW
ncbi:MAG TPA: hypothetical protein VE573_04390 [Nitrososphaeraceae archaeon]|jgi:hypothetical protein|nr:hypothetical protein [Nitrososphaeraceae archaeon]